MRKYAPSSIVAFLKSSLMSELHREDDFVNRCCIGYILQHKKDLNDGQRQKILADYLRYINT